MKLRWPGDASDGEVRLMLAQLDSDFRGEARSARPRRRSSSSMGCEPGRLGDYADIHLPYSVASGGQSLDCNLEHSNRIPIPVLRIGVRKHLADITERRRSQNRVSDGVADCIGIRMTSQAEFRWY